MKLIFATDSNFAIGLDGDMLFHISEDLKRFKAITEGNIVIMGRKTLESLPNSKPLPNRINVIVSSTGDYSHLENTYQVKDHKHLPELLEKINPDKKMEEFLIGGGALTATLIKRCDTALITMLHHSFEKADTWIPNLDVDSGWKLVCESEQHPHGDYYYTYREYRRTRPLID